MRNTCIAISFALALLAGIVLASGETRLGSRPISEAAASYQDSINKQRNSGGCDGHGTPPLCLTCSAGICETVCVGATSCTLGAFGSDGLRQCSMSGACASGSPF